jgi:hypothetical protein
LRRREKVTEDPVKKEKEAKIAQAMERYRSLENAKQLNLSKIMRVLEDPIARQSECQKIEELINPPLASPIDQVAGQIVDKKDPAVSMLESCKIGRR